MRTREGFQTLLVELEGDVQQLKNIQEQNTKAWDRICAGATDSLDYAALGFTLHQIYGVLEHYFLRLAKFFENSLPEESWEKTLLYRMGLDIPGLRPALLLEAKDKELVMVLLKFRHTFRNLYGEDLNPQLITLVQLQAQELLGARFLQIHQEFCQKLSFIMDLV